MEPQVFDRITIEPGKMNGQPCIRGLRLTVRLTRQDLADMAGITAETAIRVMSRFKRARLVSGTARCLMITNLEQLKHLATSPG